MGDEKSDLHKGCSTINREDSLSLSLSLSIFSSISLEGLAFLPIIEEGKQF